MDTKFFYCYSYPLKEFFESKGLKSVLASTHKKTGKNFWVFENSGLITEALNEWRDRRSVD